MDLIMGTSGPDKDYAMNIMSEAIVVTLTTEVYPNNRGGVLTTGVVSLTTEVHTLIRTRLPAQLIHNIGEDALSKFLELFMIVSIG